MFTGIIETTAKVISYSDGVLVLERPVSFDDIKIGSSIAVSGVCLSITAFDHRTMTFDVTSETLRVTKIGSLRSSDRVNLERAMRADARLEGHVVQGHVEGVGEVLFDVCVSSSIPRPLPPEEEGGFDRKHRIPKLLRSFARMMRKKPTRAEKILWEAIRYDQLGVRFRRQYFIGGLILDFFCPRLFLCVEVDGEIHLESAQKEKDRERDAFLALDHRVRTVRFTNNEIYQDLPRVLEKIKNSIQNSSPPPSEEGLGVEEKQQTKQLVIELPQHLLSNIIPKGSITIDGVSLTIAHIEGNRITIALIPLTLEQTTLGSLKKGDRVNIETDVLVRSAHATIPSF